MGEVIAPGRVPPVAFASFVASVQDYAMFFLDPEGVVASWNRGAEIAKGYTADEIVGKHVSVFYPPGDVASRKPQYALRVAAAEGRFLDEGWRVRKDGSMFWASVVLTAVHDDDGRLMGFAKVTRDLTSRRHAEDALRQSEERYRLLVESVKDYAIFLLDPGGRVMSWNEGARRLKGYEAEDIIGEHFSRFYRDEDIQRRHPWNELEIAIREGRYEEEGWRVRKDGSRFWANVTITTLRDPHGEHVGFAKVTRDLTARKLAEEELRQRAVSYAAINRELDAFSHTVAHDLRSPIRAIEHLSTVLIEDEAHRLTPDGQEVLRAVRSTSQSMARLVQDLLDLSASKARDIAREPVGVSEIARAVFEEQRKRYPERRIELRIPDGLRASADAHLVRIALSNLVANAVKFSRDVRDAVVEIGVDETKDGPAFYVRDNGAGFEPSRAGQLFQPFSRLHGANEFEGTGIGLATVERIVRRHGGRVWAEGEPGKGATFWFTLPEEVRS